MLLLFVPRDNYTIIIINKNVYTKIEYDIIILSCIIVKDNDTVARVRERLCASV